MDKKLEEIKFLKGKNLYLRPMKKEDLEPFLIWMNDLEIAKQNNDVFPMTKEDGESFYEELKGSDKRISLSICTNKDEFIGTITLNNIKWKDGITTSGIFIGNKDYHNKGYGTEAKMIMLNYAFNTLNLRKIYSNVFAINKRSLKCQEKCGYKQEGIRKEHVFVNGAYVDEIMLAVFKEDWLPIWEDYKKKYLDD